MTLCRVVYKRSAAKDLQQADRKHLQAIVRRIESLAHQPRPQGCVRLRREEELYKVRQGDYRIMYHVADGMVTVLAVKVGHRR